MNADLRNLLAALRDQPDDAVAYMALADWCLEQPDAATQARGEHVRLSLATAKLERGDPAGREPRERLGALLKRYRAEWLGSMRDFAHRCDFLPGGLVKVEATGGRLEPARKAKVAAPAEEDFAWVTSVTMRSCSMDDLRYLADLLPAGFVRSFTTETTGTGLADVLGRFRWAESLRAMRLTSYSAQLGYHEAERVAGLPFLAGLDTFSLSRADLPSPAFSRLLTSLGRVRELALVQCPMGFDECRTASLSRTSPVLTVLWLQGNSMGSEAGTALFHWPGLSKVSKLALDNNPLGDAALRALADSPHLRRLCDLSLNNCELTNTGLQALAAADFPSLRRLNVCSSRGIDDAGLMALCRSASLPSLRELRTDRHPLRPATFQAIKALNDR